MMSDGGAERAPSKTTASGTGQQTPEVDVEQLTDKVYRLLQGEVRLGHARGELGGARAGSSRRSGT